MEMRNCMDCTGLWMVDWETVGQMGQENLHGLYWLLNGCLGGLKDIGTDGKKKRNGLYWFVNGCWWWTERQWDRLAIGAHWEIKKKTHTFLFGN
jgi:hypothetical protein